MLKFDFRPDSRMLRQFGWAALVGFSIIGAIGAWKWGFPTWLTWGLVGLGVLMAVCSALKLDAAIRPVYVGMMAIALPIGLVISTVLLLVLYYGMFTPVALWFRIIGRDAMNRKWDPDVKTYWHDRGPPRGADSYLRLY